MRVLGAEDEGSAHGHSHTHSHGHAAPIEIDAHASGVSTASSADGLTARKGQKVAEDHARPEPAPAAPQASRLSAYLNLFGDFVHNMSVRALSFFRTPPPRPVSSARTVSDARFTPLELMDSRASALALSRAAQLFCSPHHRHLCALLLT